VPEYRYELRRGEDVIAPGHLSREQPLELGDEITIGSERGLVRTVEPLPGECDHLPGRWTVGASRCR
jgi:hypothetical protein